MANADDIVAQSKAMQASVHEGLTAGAGGLVIIAIVLGCYFIPTIVAFGRKHPQRGPILALNFLLGWSVIGWIAAFIWSLVSPPPPQTIIIQQAPAPPASQ